jgi:S1-C subfamily serine protease
MRNLVAQSEIGKQISLTVFRGGQKRVFSVKIAEPPDNFNLTGLRNYKFPAR